MSERYRTVVVQMWDGPRVIARLGPTAGLSDREVIDRLRAYNITMPATEEARRARVEEWPTATDLRAIERVYTADNDGVRPVARVLESLTVGGPAGSGSTPASTVLG